MLPDGNVRGTCRMIGANAGWPPRHGRYTRRALAERRKVRAILRMLRRLIGEAR